MTTERAFYRILYMNEDHKNKIAGFYKKNRRMPTYSEIMNLTGYKSKSSVAYLIDKLIKSDILSKDKKGRLVPDKLYGEVPFVGLVEAGFPSPAEEELSDTLSLDDYLIENREATYLMRAKGESMKDAGICDGDMLLVERKGQAKVGEIVIALIDGERTMKYLRKKGRKYFLEAANKKYKPIQPKNELRIEAVVKAVLRKY